MAGRRHARKTGQGMTPLFDLAPLTRPAESNVPARPVRDRAAPSPPATQPPGTPTPVDYWVRGLFRCGDGRFTRTVHAVGMSTRIDADVARFTRYLATEGFQFAEGRGVLIDLLGVGSDDGVQISISGDPIERERASNPPVRAVIDR